LTLKINGAKKLSTMSDEFKIPDITRLFGLKRNLLQQWLDRGFIEASIQRSTKKGEVNLFSEADLYLIRFFQKLLAMGFSWDLAHRISKNSTRVFRKNDFNKYLVGKCLVTELGLKVYQFQTIGDPNKYYVRMDLDVGIESQDFGFVIFFNLERIIHDVDSLIS
jgi:hypothetical protein